MALKNIEQHTPPAGRDLSQALAEIQGLTFTLVDGDTSATDIAVAGIDTDDTIISVIHNTAGALADVTSEASITSEGNIQLDTTDTSGDQLLVVWFDKGAL